MFRSQFRMTRSRALSVAFAIALSSSVSQARNEFLLEENLNQSELTKITSQRNFQPDAPRAGGPIEGLSPELLDSFNTGFLFFSLPHSVQGTEPGAPVNGLGPTFNHSNCLACHSHPGPGGSSPAINPLVAIATQFGARNKVPSFIKIDGPIREVRLRRRPNGTPDGSVHQIYSIRGREDAVGCEVPQRDFEKEVRANNVSFRIPSPIFGGGLVELIQDIEILENMTANAGEKRKLGISGRPNRDKNTGTVTRFGWKAQNPSLEVFAGEAYNVEQGVTNDIFPTKRASTETCNFNPQPEDTIRFDIPPPFTGLSAVNAFTSFSKFLAPPKRGVETTSTRNGEKLFKTVGCAQCHTPQLHTGNTIVPAFAHKPVNLFSDLLLHNMGPGLADHITQAEAGPDEFRTAPLWGVGQRLFFLHDGRATDLLTAIRAHASSSHSFSCKQGAEVDAETGVSCHSEANAVINAFNRLKASERQDIINFLKIL